jgi:hypothetical protein
MFCFLKNILINNSKKMKKRDYVTLINDKEDNYLSLSVDVSNEKIRQI